MDNPLIIIIALIVANIWMFSKLPRGKGDLSEYKEKLKGKSVNDLIDMFNGKSKR